MINEHDQVKELTQKEGDIIKELERGSSKSTCFSSACCFLAAGATALFSLLLRFKRMNMGRLDT